MKKAPELLRRLSDVRGGDQRQMRVTTTSRTNSTSTASIGSPAAYGFAARTADGAGYGIGFAAGAGLPAMTACSFASAAYGTFGFT